MFILFLSLIPATKNSQAQVGRGTGVPVEALPKELKGLDIKDYSVPTSFKKVGVIHALGGMVVVIHRDTREAYFGKEGDYVHENDSLNTLTDSQCRIKFFNDDIVTMAANTEFGVERFQDQRKEGKKSSLFSLVKGKAMFYAMRLFRYKETQFRVKTPTAIMGVRGTKFGAHVYWLDEEKRSDSGIRVADSSNKPDIYLAQADSGPIGKSYTDAFCVDGFLDVDGKPVGPGEMFMGRTGVVVPTPPEIIKAIEQEARVRKAGSMSDEGAGEENENEMGKVDLSDTGETADPGEQADMNVNTADKTRQYRRAKAVSEAVSIISGGKTAGFIGSIATLITGKGGTDKDGRAWVDTNPAKSPFYQGVNSLENGGNTKSHVAFEYVHEDNGNYKMVVLEQTSTKKAIVSQFAWGHVTNKALGTPHILEWNAGGNFANESGSEYLRWGYWEDPSATDTGLIGQGVINNFYAASGRIWGVGGALTHPDVITFLHLTNRSYTYTGGANGVYAESPASNVINLSGIFGCKINFGSARVNNFELKVSGGGNVEVHMKNGSGTLKSNGHFIVEGFQGNINGNNNIAGGFTGAEGALFGGKAEGTGGIWHAGDGAGKWATGEFHGKR